MYKLGEIVSFEVQAKCPHCHENTEVFRRELIEKVIVCQHCDEQFLVELD
ncbi:hypothetical protein L5L78_17570 [Shewanella sp. SM34]|nr:MULTISPECIES: hypothetical protein [unclassified Shewanella]MCU8058079.1 hypothetical protein [Shewanella sp. SM35]MCU8066909.1 hypothetical protein [Shewanella sp. SM34]